MGVLRTKGSTWSAHLHVNFQSASPTFPHAIVMLLYLFCLGTNRGEGPKVGQHSVLALPWLSLCPRGGSQTVTPLWPLRSPQQPYRAGRSALFIEVSSEQAPDHGNVPALGHRPYASVSGGSLMISTRLVLTIFLFNPSLACPHH